METDLSVIERVAGRNMELYLRCVERLRRLLEAEERLVELVNRFVSSSLSTVLSVLGEFVYDVSCGRGGRGTLRLVPLAVDGVISVFPVDDRVVVYLSLDAVDLSQARCSLSAPGEVSVRVPLSVTYSESLSLLIEAFVKMPRLLVWHGSKLYVLGAPAASRVELRFESSSPRKVLGNVVGFVSALNLLLNLDTVLRHSSRRLFVDGAVAESVRIGEEAVRVILKL